MNIQFTVSISICCQPHKGFPSRLLFVLLFVVMGRRQFFVNATKPFIVENKLVEKAVEFLNRFIKVQKGASVTGERKLFCDNIRWDQYNTTTRLMKRSLNSYERVSKQ